jgi:hypothetical protein
MVALLCSQARTVVRNEFARTMARNSVAVFDPALVRQQSQAELREKAAPKKVHEVNKIGSQSFEVSEDTSHEDENGCRA